MVESLSPEDRTVYDKNMRNEFDLRTEKLMAREEARAEGLAEGRAEGRAEGEASGFVSVAKAMIREKMPLKQIQKFTNLSLPKLKEISKEIGVALVM